MTLRVIEGFDYLVDSPSSQVLGALGWSGDLGSIRFLTRNAFGYGKSLQWIIAANNNICTKFLRGQWTTPYIFGMRMNVPTNGYPSNPVNPIYSLTALDTTSSRNEQWRLAFDSYGTITLLFFNGDSRGVLAKTLPWAFVPGNWFYLEIKITPGITGSIEIRVNTVPVLSLTNVRLGNGSPVLPATALGITHLSWQYSPIASASGLPSPEWGTDDLYFLTLDGGDNDDYLGNVRVKYMEVIGDDTPIDWSIGGTSPAPTNWQSVRNRNLNDEQYVFSSTVGDQDFYSIDPNLNTPYVYGIEVGAAYRMDDATQRFVANAIKSGSAQAVGETYAINQTYTFYYSIYERNPDTGVAFTGAEANALKIGPKVMG